MEEIMTAGSFWNLSFYALINNNSDSVNTVIKVICVTGDGEL